MRTRHEQVQAHRFVTRRIVSALLSGEPETTELPMRRLAMALFGSLLVAAIVLAVVGIYGFLNPAGGKPENGDIVVMRETGTRYVVNGGTLHPVLNWASALLFAGTDRPTIRTMSRRSLSAYTVGRPIGIPGAPDPPPDRKALVGLPWSVCNVRGRGGPTAFTTQVVVGRVPGGGRGLGERGLLVTAGDTPTTGTRYLLWSDRRYKVADQAALTALELAGVPAVRVGQPLLNALAAGPDLAPPRINRAGAPSARQVAGAAGRIGQVYRSGNVYYVLLDNGLASIGDVTAKLLLAREPNVIDVTAAEAARVLVGDVVEPANFPSTMPQLVRGEPDTSMICAGYRDSDGDDRTTVEVFGAGGERLVMDPADSTAREGRDGVRTADRVLVDSGRGALVRVLPAPGVRADTTVYLVTDQGFKFALRDSATVQARVALGYAGVEPVPIPATLLALLPTGPTLDPVAAGQLYTPPAPPVPTRSAQPPPARNPNPSPTPAGPGAGAGAAPSPSPSG